MVGEALEYGIRWSVKVSGDELPDYEEYWPTLPVWDHQTIQLVVSCPLVMSNDCLTWCEW